MDFQKVIFGPRQVVTTAQTIRRLRIQSKLFVLIFGVGTAICVAQRPNCKLGVSLNVTAHGGSQELIASILEERKLGCNAMEVSVKWDEIEPTPGVFRLEKLKSDLGGQIQMGFTPYLLIKTIDTSRRSLPADLIGEAWDSPRMLARANALLSAVSSVLPAGMGGVMLGNEVDGYLAGRPNEVSPFVQFLESGRRALKFTHPALPVGVTTMFTGLANHRNLIERVHAPMDFVSMTYYPLTPDFRVMLPSHVDAQFAQMLGFSPTKKLFIQEAGYPASPLLGSSESDQAGFVDAVFDAMKRYDSRLEGVCFFLLVDFSDSLVNQFVRYYGLAGENFRAMLSTLGLKKQDGTPRAAWATFQRRALGR